MRSLLLAAALGIVLFITVGCATSSGGRVVDTRGNPVRAIVRGYWRNAPPVHGERTAVESVWTDEHGRFTFDVSAKPDRIEAEALDAKRYGYIRPVSANHTVVVVK